MEQKVIEKKLFLVIYTNVESVLVAVFQFPFGQIKNAKV